MEYSIQTPAGVTLKYELEQGDAGDVQLIQDVLPEINQTVQHWLLVACKGAIRCLAVLRERGRHSTAGHRDCM